MTTPSRADRPILLVGCPRSGTTLVQLMLHAHPRLAVPPENRWTLPAYYRRKEWGDLQRAENRLRLARFVVGHRRSFANFGLSAEAVEERILDAPPTLGSALESVLRLYAEQAGAARWCDKRPVYVRHVPALRRLYPDAQFVHVIRDGRAVASSLLRTPWFRGDLAQAIGTWRMCQAYADRARAALPGDQWLDLSYEQVVADPEPQLRRLAQFLGEEFDPAMLAPGAVKAQVVPERKTWHANTGGDLLPDRIEAWRTDLDPADVALVEAVAGRQLRRAGYRTGHAQASPDRRRVARFALSYPRRAAWHRRAQMMDDRSAVREAARLGSLYRRAT